MQINTLNWLQTGESVVDERIGARCGSESFLQRVWRFAPHISTLSSLVLAMSGANANPNSSHWVGAHAQGNAAVFMVAHGEIASSPSAVMPGDALLVESSEVGVNICRAQIDLVGPAGAEKVQIDCQGRTARLRPAQELLPDASYTLFVQLVGATQFQTTTFKTRPIAAQPLAARPLSGLEEWQPETGDQRSWSYAWGARPAAPALADLAGKKGHTAVAGRLQRFGGEPLAGVTVSLSGKSTRSDRHGRFLLEDVPAGAAALDVDGTSVVIHGGHYTRHYIHVDLSEGATTDIARPIYLARVDPATEVSIASPTDHDLVLTHPAMPGLQVRIPKGVVLRNQDGSLVTKVSLTPVPVDRGPYPTPLGFPIYFTLQPGGAFVDAQSGKSIEIIYPNDRKLAAGTVVDFWNYDPESGWKIYGNGKVSEDRKTIVATATPDAGIGVREVMTFGYGLSSTPPPAGPTVGGQKEGDPVDLATGIFATQRTDLQIADVVPISLTRSYAEPSHVKSTDQPMSTNPRTFGVGWTLSYDMSLYTPNGTDVDVVLADNTLVPFKSAGSNLWRCTTVPAGAFYGATLARIVNPNYAHNKQYEVTLADQSKLHFDGDSNQLLEMLDRNGNRVAISRSSGTSGAITQITSPNGRFIQFTYTGALVTQATDNYGRVVTYGYNTDTPTPRLTSVIDADQTGQAQPAALGYSYDSSHRLWVITDKRGNAAITNLYDANSRVIKQTLADGTTWGYSYNLGNTVSVTNPRGYITTYSLTNGYVTQILAGANATAPDTPQVTTLVRDANNLVVGVLDPLGRMTNIEYDGMGHVATLTRLANKPGETVTQQWTYEPSFNQVSSFTDELNHT
ncbi:MAG: hypothetical protein JO171_09485, partial [Paludibacterium sp.]|nr:hypothetical protein [Paludibacterium sp.]